SKMSFHQALDLIFELDEMMVGCTRDILRQRDFLDRFSEISWVIPTFIVIEGENCWIIDYKQINALYKDFVPQKELSAEQKYFPSSFMPSDKTSNATTFIPSSMLNNSLQAEIKQIKWKSIKIQEGLQARIKILEKDVQRCEKQSVNFKLKLQHEKEKHKWDSALKNNNTKSLDYSWISKMEKLEHENVSLDFQVQSSIKECDNLAQSKTLDTTSVVSKPKIDVGSASKAKNTVFSAPKTKKGNLRDKSLSTYMKNKIRTSRIWQKWFESQPNVVWSPVNTNPNIHNSCSSEKPSVSVMKWVVKLPICPYAVSSDSGCSKHMTGDRSLLRNFIEKFMGTVCFGIDNFAVITGYNDYIQGNITICHVYYVEGLGHNLFSVGQFCDGDLEVALMLWETDVTTTRNQLVVRQPTAFKSERPRISKPLCDSQVDVHNDLSKPVTTHYLPKEREDASAKPHYMIAYSNSRISSKNMTRFSSNDMVHNRYLEEAKARTQERSRNSEPSLLTSAISQSTANEHLRNSRNDSCVTKFLKEVNSCAKVPSNKATNKNKPVEQTGVPLQTRKTDLNVGLRWVPTGRILTSSTTKVYSEPLNGSTADIINQYECGQTLDVNAELGLYDHSNEQSSSKLVPKVVPPADKIAAITPRVLGSLTTSISFPPSKCITLKLIHSQSCLKCILTTHNIKDLLYVRDPILRVHGSCRLLKGMRLLLVKAFKPSMNSNRWGISTASDDPELVRNSSRISARIWGSNVCKAF
nr:integrase, catalytic region, zinc finger, CCHC-type, peptidase aspartic, catalytic [Tanacetum cinerariifolium]